MSNSLNSIQLIGNLGAVELKATAGGKPYLKMRLACNETWKDADGAKQEKCNWFNATLWGPRAESLAKYLNKGDLVFLSGSMQFSTSEKDGVKYNNADVNVREVVLIGGKSSSRSDADETGGEANSSWGEDERPGV